MQEKENYLYPVIGSEVTESVNFGMDPPFNKKFKTTYMKDVLIIEDSTAVSLVIHKFLKNLGYENIYTCTNGRKGIKIFRELADFSKTPIVFLDYSLPDMTGDQIMEQIFDINPDAKIIIESANEKNDEAIKEILRHGAYDFLEKPIRFENIRNIMKVIEKEEEIIEDKQDYNFNVKW
jgi:DNA-binding NtrC family response regulator